MSLVSLTWDRDPLARLEELKKSLQNRIIRNASTKAARVIAQMVKSNTAGVKRYGFLKKAINIKVVTYPVSIVAIIGARSKDTFQLPAATHRKVKQARPAFYLHLVERGGKRLRAHPVLAPAFSAGKQEYFRVLCEETRKGITAQLAK